MTRAFVIVMDSVGCGGAPDAGDFGDEGANTLAHILGLELSANGHAIGRVMTEALTGGGPPPEARAVTVRSQPAANGFITVLNTQEAAGETYFDAAGMPGRTLGLKP